MHVENDAKAKAAPRGTKKHSCMLRVAVGARRGLAGSAAGLRGGGARIAAALLSDGISTLARRPAALPRPRTSPPRASSMDFLEGFRLGATREDARAAAAAAAAVRTLAAARAAEGDDKRKRDDDDDDEWHVSDSEDERGQGALGIDTNGEEAIASVKRERSDDEQKKEEEEEEEEEEARQFLGGSYGDAVAIDAASLGTPTKTAVAASKFFHPRMKNSRTPSDEANIATEPPGWRAALDAIRAHRSNRTASVDVFHDFLLSLRDAPDAHFQALVASLLSVQCRDVVALGEMRNLRVALGGECTVHAVANAPDGVVEEAIRRCNYGRTKARYVRQCADAIINDNRFKGRVPADVEGLTLLPGVGPKIARLVASVAFGDDRCGMVVDTHVRRVCGRLGWTREGVERRSAEGTRKRLEAWLPPELWAETTQLLVGFGQETCAPRVPRCGECPLSGTCPSSTVKTKASGTDVEDL